VEGSTLHTPTDCCTMQLQIGLTWGRQMSLKHSSGLYKVGLTVIHKFKKLEEPQNDGDWGGAYRAAATFFFDLSDTSYRNHRSAGGRMAQALVVYLALLSSKLHTDLEIQHPLIAGRRHCRR